MRKSTQLILQDFFYRYPQINKDSIVEAVNEIIDCYKKNNKLLVCGNGGSAADSLHIVGELMKGFKLPRKLDNKKEEKINELFPHTSKYFVNNLQMPLPAISLVNETALTTAFANDKVADLSFAQQVLGLGKSGDILIAISTSGNSNNVFYAAQIAKIQGMSVISLTGHNGGKLRGISDILINVPSNETYIIQEYHLPVYHAICAAVENEMFSTED